jgi:hypothetical protein
MLLIVSFGGLLLIFIPRRLLLLREFFFVSPQASEWEAELTGIEINSSISSV